MSLILDVDHVGKTFVQGGLLSRREVEAVRDVSFSLDAERPEILSVVGESGSGKSTLAAMVLGRLVPTRGRILFEGGDVAAIRSRAGRRAFMARVQPVLQNPFEAFNPLKRVDRYLFATAANFVVGGGRTRAAIEERVDRALVEVGLTLAEVRGRFPHELSGGQLQRTAIARALIPEPRLLVADEPVSMVDASLRMAIVNLFGALRDRLGLSIIYITHDLATAYYISDRILIMRKGEVVERGAARAVLDNPQHPYSIALKQAVLTPDFG
ncbi:ABC transporter ATP-binding protein [Pleomorphomonas koreensis]|uniref:ABC transporter ATP-binding protein n=1 Tax=Pleomorphomonas koreensis TaxID=257440 RepID=UPI0004096DCE|nr:ABC transporter ATP-binding protein [Pleomorphomonas koreensis]